MHGYPSGFPRVLAVTFTLLAVTGLALVPGVLVVRLAWENVPWHAAGDLRTAITGAHVFLGYAWILLLGALWSRHMRNGWRVRHRRPGGALQGVAALVLVLSALVVLYAGEDATALYGSLVHLAAALLATLAVVQHVRSARRHRRGDDRRHGRQRR